MVTTDATPFGDLLRRYRMAAGLTQEELAERAGLSAHAISDLERGARRSPYRDTIRLLADALQLTDEERRTLEVAARRVREPAIATLSPSPSSPSPPPAPRSTLPTMPTSFIGREQEVASVCDLLHRKNTHLLTLTGTGGTGKTRLALEVGSTLLPQFPHGVVFVSLAPISDPALVLSAIATVLEVQDTGGRDLLQAVKLLTDKQLLLILDNFEHLLEAAPIVSALLDGSPQLRILITSRAPLHLYGEQEFPVPPLAVPDPEHLPPVEIVSQSEAIRLFVERARAVKPSFVLSDATVGAVVEICHRLDGLPLSIELAAARIKLFSPPALLSRLASRLILLTGGARDLPSRQQSLRATIDWSHSLLSDGEQRLFARLSVFAGGCTLEAAEAVCNAEGDLGIDVLDGMAGLVDKGLLQQKGEEEPRFVMLETIREYAHEKLEERGEVGELRRRHALSFLTVAESAASEDVPTRQRAEEEERDNLSAALEWAWEHRELEIGLRLAVAWDTFWHMFDYRSGLRWLERLLALEGRKGAVSPQLQAQALQLASRFAWYQGNAERSRALAEEGVALGRELGDKRELADGLQALGWLLREQGDYAGATALLTEALSLAREGDHQFTIALALIALGDVARETGDAQRVIELCEESLQLFREIGNRAFIALSLHNLGWAAWMRGDLDRARRLYEEALRLFRESGAGSNNSEFLNSLALVVREQGDVQTAQSLLAESLSLCRMPTVPVQESAIGLERMAGVAAIQGQAERAARLFGAAHALRLRVGNPIWPVIRPLYERDLAVVREALGEERFAEEWEEGRAMTAEQAGTYALQEADGGMER